MGTSFTRSDAADAQNQYEQYRFCYENGHSEWVERAARNMSYFLGEQWHPLDVAKRRHAGKPHLSLNVIESLIRAMKGVQRAMRNDVRFQPVDEAGADMAEVHDNLWLHTQNENDLDFLETDIWERGLITGRAYYDVRMDYDENMKGQIKVRKKRSQDVILDPAIDDYDTRTWPQVITRQWVNKLELEHKFGKSATKDIAFTDSPNWYQFEDQMMAQRLGRLPYYYYGGAPDQRLMRAYLQIERQYKELIYKDVFIDLKTGDFERVPDNWDREKVGAILDAYKGELGTMRRKVETIKWKVTCENVVLHDSESPYRDYTIVPFFPTFVDGATMSIVDSLIDPQNLYNKMTSEELSIITTTAHSGYKLKKGSLKNMTTEELEQRGSSSGFIAELDNVADLEKIQPSQLPAGHDRLSFKADAIMRQLAGVPNQIRGFAREDVAGEAIEMNQAGADLNYAAFLSNLHRSKSTLARRCQALWQDNYDETRTLMINKGSTFKSQFESIQINLKTPEGQVVNDITKGKYTTILVPSPARTSLNAQELDQLIEMRKELGIKIPDDVFIEMSNIPHKSRLLARMKQDQNEVAQRQEQREEEEFQQEKALNAAKIQKEQSTVTLNQAKAQKTQGEAGQDPDAAYKQVEFARIDADKQVNEAKLQLEWAKENREKLEGQRDDAIELTKIRVDANSKAEDRKVKEKQAMKPRTPSKPKK